MVKEREVIEKFRKLKFNLTRKNFSRFLKDMVLTLRKTNEDVANHRFNLLVFRLLKYAKNPEIVEDLLPYIQSYCSMPIIGKEIKTAVILGLSHAKCER